MSPFHEPVRKGEDRAVRARHLASARAFVRGPRLSTRPAASGLPFVRRGARVVDWAGLANRCARKGTVGSNPTLSATTID